MAWYKSENIYIYIYTHTHKIESYDTTWQPGKGTVVEHAYQTKEPTYHRLGGGRFLTTYSILRWFVKMVLSFQKKKKTKTCISIHISCFMN